MDLYVIEWKYWNGTREKETWKYFEAESDEKAREYAIDFLKEKAKSQSYDSRYIQCPRLIRIVALPTIEGIELYTNPESWWEFSHYFFTEEEKKILFKRDSTGRFIPSSWKGKMR